VVVAGLLMESLAMEVLVAVAMEAVTELRHLAEPLIQVQVAVVAAQKVRQMRVAALAVPVS
jgi:hypothetical protein